MRLRRRSHRAVVLGLAGVLVLAGCGDDDDDSAAGASEGSEASEGSGSGGSITVRGCNPQNTLIPTNTTETCGGNVLDQVTGKLMRYNPDTAAAELDIAKSIESDDNKTFTITLNEGIMFHDGTEVKAKNFVDAWNFGAYGPNAQSSSYFFEPIAGYAAMQSEDPDDDGPKEAPEPKAKTFSGLKVVDDYTFTVKLDQASSTFPQRLGYTAFAPLPDSFFEDDGETFGENPIGAGPFKFVKWDKNREIVLEADPNYDRAGKPSIDGVTFKIFRESSAAYAELLANQIDLIDDLPTEALAGGTYKDELAGQYVQRAQGVIQTMTFPPSKTDSSYDEPKLRQAISLSIDRQKIIDSVFDGLREPATSWTAPAADGYLADTCGGFCEYDPERAKKLFDEAGGYDGTMTLSYNADSDHKTWTEAVCGNINQALGVKCRAVPVVDFATFRTQISEQKMEGMFRTGWQMDYPSIENFLVPIFATGASSNDGLYSNAAFDKLLKQAAAQDDPAQVNALYQKAEKLLAKDMPSVPLWFGQTVHGHSDRVTNVKITAFGTYDLSSIQIK